MFSIESEIPLKLACTKKYRGLASDGCRYYLALQGECCILVLDHCFCLIDKVKTCRPYSALSYDPERKCFWAAAERASAVLFKLDSTLQECAQLTLELESCGPINSLSYCCTEEKLLAALGSRVLVIDPASGQTRLLREERQGAVIVAVVSLAPQIIYSVQRGSSAYFVLMTCTGEVLSEKRDLAAQVTKALLLTTDDCSSETYRLLLLTGKKDHCPGLFCARLDRELTRSLDPCHQAVSCCTQHCSCDKDPCHDDHHPCCDQDPCPCKDPCPPDPGQPCSDILGSIALQEAAIAHILNAEGEKLQKIIAISNDPCEILQTNSSVQKTILYAANLEQVLLSKLEALRSICCFCESDDPPFCNYDAPTL